MGSPGAHFGSKLGSTKGLREHSSLRPFFAISYLRELKVCVWVSNVKKMN